MSLGVTIVSDDELPHDNDWLLLCDDDEAELFVKRRSYQSCVLREGIRAYRSRKRRMAQEKQDAT